MPSESGSEKKAAKTVKRPKLVRLRADAKAGRLSGQRLYIFRLDRLTRSGIRDTLEVLEELRSGGCEVVAVSDGFPLSGPCAEVVIAVMSWASAMELRAKNERIAAARERVEAEGGSWGRPRRMSDSVIAEAVAMREAGKTIRAIAIALKIPRATLGRTLASLSQNVAKKRDVDGALHGGSRGSLGSRLHRDKEHASIPRHTLASCERTTTRCMEWLMCSCECASFIGSLRRKCLDHVLLLGEEQLCQLLSDYVGYFGGCRPHQGRPSCLALPTTTSWVLGASWLSRTLGAPPRLSEGGLGMFLSDFTTDELGSQHGNREKLLVKAQADAHKFNRCRLAAAPVTARISVCGQLMRLEGMHELLSVGVPSTHFPQVRPAVLR